MNATLMIGWTTLESQEDARRLAQAAVEQRLVSCVQIDGPIESIYRWEGRVESSREYRLTLKFPASAAESVEAWLLESHPYDTPQWVVVAADRVSPAYLDWASKLE